MFSQISRLLLLLLLILQSCSSVSTQEVKNPALTGARDKAKEDVVAKLFETIRVDAKIPPLTRINHRDSLEQRVCTMAQTSTLGNRHSGDLVGFYKTTQPESISAELIKVASFNKEGPKNNLAYPRYSIAVWLVKDSQTGEATYWVGVERYWSAFEEFVDYHLTDDAYYHDGWKKNVAPQCRGK